MPTRVVRDDMLRSEPIDALSMGAELFFRRLWSVVDDYGRYYATPKILKADCYPLREDKSGLAVEEWLRECEQQTLVRVYQVAGKQYLEIVEFDQRMRAKKSRFPDPEEDQGKPVEKAEQPIDRTARSHDRSAPSDVGQMPVTCPSHARTVRADARHVPAERGHMPDICPPLRTRATGGEGESGSGVEGGGEARTREDTPPPSEHEAGQIAELLRTAMARGTPLPDGDIVRRVHAVRQGATLAELAAVLVAYRRQRRRAPDSYGFWPIYLADALAPRARESLNAIEEPKLAREVEEERKPSCLLCYDTGVVGLKPDVGGVCLNDIRAKLAEGGRWCGCGSEIYWQEFYQESYPDEFPATQREAVAS